MQYKTKTQIQMNFIFVKLSLKINSETKNQIIKYEAKRYKHKSVL